MRIFIVIAFSVIVSSCASLNKSQCISGDWYGIGLQDGTRGASLSNLSRHREACLEHGVSINGDLYRQGREEGLKTYCRPRNGYYIGLKGYSYNNVCPDHLNREFSRAYQMGHKIFHLQQDIAVMQDKLKIEEKLTLDETLSREERNEHLDAFATIKHDLESATRLLNHLIRTSPWER